MAKKASDGNRLDIIDIVKGVLIIFVVLGHTNTSLRKWIYSFHMAAFFAISGFLWNPGYVESRTKMYSFIRKRIQRIYIPFVGVNILFIALNNFLIHIGIYTTDPLFAEWTANWPVSQLSNEYSFHQILLNCAKSFLLISGHAPIVGVSWYLATLLIVSFAHLTFELLTKRLTLNQKVVFYSFMMAGCLLASTFITETNAKIPGEWILCRVFPAYFAFIFGYIFQLLMPMLKKVSSHIPKLGSRGLIVIISLIGLIMVILDSRSIDLSKGEIITPSILSLHSFRVSSSHLFYQKSSKTQGSPALYNILEGNL